MGNPYITGFPWAGGIAPAGTPASYPSSSNPWSTLTTQDVPAYTFFTPSPTFAPTAQELNRMFAQRDQALLYINGAQGPYQVIEDISVTKGVRRAQTDTSGTDAHTNSTAQTWGATTFTAANTYALATAAVATQVGDVMDVAFQGTLYWQAGNTGSIIDFLVELWANLNGAGNTASGIQTSWTQLGVAVSNPNTFTIPISLRGLITIGSGHAGTFALGINGCMAHNFAATPDTALTGLSTTRLRHLRPF